MQAHMFHNKQNLLVKRHDLQQLECAKILHLLHHLSNNMIEEIDQKNDIVYNNWAQSNQDRALYIHQINTLLTHMYSTTHQLSYLRTYQ